MGHIIRGYGENLWQMILTFKWNRRPRGRAIFCPFSCWYVTAPHGDREVQDTQQVNDFSIVIHWVGHSITPLGLASI